jgi:glycosyltransferase involved in cell wall biosynthesis
VLLSRTLKVALPEHLAQRRCGGDGRVWAEALGRLGGHVRLRPGGRGDVTLTDVTAPDAGDGPRVAVVHEASWVLPDFAAALHPAERDWVDGATRAAVRAAARVLVPSRVSASQVRALCGDVACDVVPYGVDRRVWRLDPDAAREPGTVLFVGAAHPKKNLGALREACVVAGARRLELVTHPAARPDGHELLAELTAPLEGVEVVVHRDLDDAAVAARMRRATVLALPSLGEGFGLPAAEALACGTPVVVSDRGSLPEVVGAAGIVTGVDAASIAAGLRRALDGAAPDPALAPELSWEAMAEGWAAALRRAAEEGRP